MEATNKPDYTVFSFLNDVQILGRRYCERFRHFDFPTRLGQTLNPAECTKLEIKH